MYILKLFVDTFVSFLKRVVIIISLGIENIVVLDLYNSKKEKNGKYESVKVVQEYSLLIIVNFAG